jgi:hypothetical protein
VHQVISKTLKSLLLFVSLTILIQVFYAVQTSTDFFSSTRYFPYGYAIHLAYYLSFLVVVFLFVGKLDFGAVGLKRVPSWKKYILIGMLLALLGAGLKIVFLPGTFSQSFYAVPYYLLAPAFIVLGTLIAIAEESAFRRIHTQELPREIQTINSNPVCFRSVRYLSHQFS